MPNSSNLCSRSGQRLRGWNSVLNSFGRSTDILEVPPAGRDSIDVSDPVTHVRKQTLIDYSWVRTGTIIIIMYG